MGFALHAACASSKGLIRGNHEDIFYFGGKCLEAGNDGLRHPVMLDARLEDGESRHGICRIEKAKSIGLKLQNPSDYET